eukprot:g8714.t1
MMRHCRFPHVRLRLPLRRRPPHAAGITRTAGIEYSDYVCQETCRYVTKGEPKDPSPSDGRDKVKVYRAGGVEPERGELALCVSKGEKQSSDKEAQTE